MSRDKKTTKQRLINAVGEILRKEGFHGIGVNAIAKNAGVDKVLIYRYFGNLDGLLKAFIAQKDYFSNLKDILGESMNVTDKQEAIEVSKQIFVGQLRQILHNKELQEILLWELHHKNHVTDAVAEAREQQGKIILQEMSRVVDFNKVDFPAIANILIGGIYYLILRSRIVNMYNEIDLSTDEGWQRMENAILHLLDTLANNI